MQPPPLNGFAPESASGRGASEEASGALYEAAKVHSNREAAAECSAKAEEAVSADDFDKAVRLLQGPLSLPVADRKQTLLPLTRINLCTIQCDRTLLAVSWSHHYTGLAHC